MMAAILAAIGCFIDLFSKSWVFNWLGPPTTGRIHWLWPNHIGLQTSLNTGALFGMGQGGVGILAVISLLAAIGVFVWLTWGGASHDRFISIVLGLITGGILGNMYDRMGLGERRPFATGSCSSTTKTTCGPTSISRTAYW